MKYLLVDNFSIKETKDSMKSNTKWWKFLILNILLFFILGIISNLFPVLVSLILAKNIDGGINALQQQLNDGTIPNDYSAVIMLAYMFSYLISIAGFYLFNRFYYKRNNASLGLIKKGNIVSYVKGILLGGLSFSLVVFIVLISGNLKLSGPFAVNPIIFIGFIIGWMIQGFFEEWVIRSIFMNGLAAKSNNIVAIISTSLLFAVLHAGNPGFTVLAFINLLLIGLIFALVFYLTDNILVPAAFHSSWNFFQGNLYGVEVSGSTTTKYYSILHSEVSADNILLTGGNFGLEASIACTIVLTVLLSICVYIIYKKKLFQKIEISSQYE